MPTDRFFRRRMAIDKFNNRPPFDIKKLDDSTSVECGGQRSFTHHCNNNCEGKIINRSTKSYRNVVRYFEEVDGRYQNSMKNKSKNIIPKIIESFQRITPKKHPKVIKPQKTDSLHTLYRNNCPNFGKNIPDHKLMKDLLQGCESEDASVHNQSTYLDEIPSRDTNTKIKRYDQGNLKTRIDKQTSTTGLTWPISSDRSELNLKTSKCTLLNKNMNKARSRIPQFKSTHAEKTSANNKSLNAGGRFDKIHLPSNSELEYLPTRDNQNCYLHKKNEKFTDKQNIQHMSGAGVSKEVPQCKFNARHDNLKKEQTYVVHVDRNVNSNSTENGLNADKRKKEKSFVQLQVEKYNKINKNPRSKPHISNNSLKAKNFQESRKNINKNYIDIMASMRETLPNLGDSCVDSNVDNHDWCDNMETLDNDVKFPKETRTAMENLRMECSRRVPLTKYTKSQNIQIQPAIPTVSQTKTDYGEEKKTMYKKINQLPCSKNLLCSRGNHEGPCKLDKGPVPRYEHPKNRTKFAK